MGTWRSSMSQYRANFSQHTCTGPVTRLGRWVGLPAWRRACFHRKYMARPPSMQASEEPTVEVPTGLPARGAFQRSASMWTHRDSISAVWGYSSLSIMFLSMHRSMSSRTSSSA